MHIQQLLGCFVLLSAAAMAQAPETFKTRLAPVAIDVGMKVNIAGLGTATATLAGAKLTVNGTFEGLKTNATKANIHQGAAAGVRGPVILDLTVSNALKGSIDGTFTLTPAQVERLKKGNWYIQIDSEKAPEGNLWGWLLK